MPLSSLGHGYSAMMMTSGHSQYLHPDYMQPLPTTLDANKSPLALLAQTCSAIGNDPTPPKADKNVKTEESGRESTDSKSNAPSMRSVSPSVIQEKGIEKKDRRSPDFRAPVPQEVPPLVPIQADRRATPEPKHRTSPPAQRHQEGNGRPSSRGSPSPTSRPSHHRGSSVSPSHHMMSSPSHQSGSSVSRTSVTSPQVTTLPSTMRHEHLAGSLPPSLYPGLPYMGHLGHPGLEPGGLSSHLQHPSLTAVSAKLSQGYLHGLHGLHGLSPFTYPRMRTTSGATSGACKDPYCNCQVLQSHSPLCPPGCTPEKHSPSSFTSSALTSSLSPSSLPSASSLSSAAHLSALYGHAFGVLPGHPTSPFVCNWAAGSDYCGKRFTSSEELMMHLRSHTSVSEAASLRVSEAASLRVSEAASLPPGYPGIGLSAHAHYALAAAHAHAQHGLPYQGPLSPGPQRTAYPAGRSLSPTSASLLAASRYHPYKSPFLPSPSSSLSGLPGALPPYYSPYAALYSHRLGAVAP